MSDTHLLWECLNIPCPEFLALLSMKCPEFLHSTASHLFFLSHFFWGWGGGGMNNQSPSHELIFKMIVWHVPVSSAAGQPGYLMHEQHNLIKPNTAVGNANKNCKGGTSL
jgi:hypothetical protein